MNDIANNIKIINKHIKEAIEKYGRQANSVRLLAVSKKQSIDKIKIAVKAGQTAFAENFAQEALEKIDKLQDLNLEWHFIGAIQSNKTKAIAEHFSWVHSVCREKIAIRLNEQRPRHLPPLNVCIEVNVDEETSKSGINVTEIAELAEEIEQLPQLKLRGLMAIPKAKEDFSAQRQSFAKVLQAFIELQNKGFIIDTLSMGMSNDYEAAIAEGATIIRIGTALFGEREF